MSTKNQLDDNHPVYINVCYTKEAQRPTFTPTNGRVHCELPVLLGAPRYEKDGGASHVYRYR